MKKLVLFILEMKHIIAHSTNQNLINTLKN